MIRLRRALAIVLGPALAFVVVACTSSSSPPDPGVQSVKDGSVLSVSDSGAAADDDAAEIDSASPAHDSGDAESASDAAVRSDAAALCVGCASRLSVNGPLAPTCTTNGPPSSHTLLDDWGECLCTATTCESTCAICANGQAAVTQACLNCGQEQCPSQYAACAADTEGFTGDAGD